MSRISKQTYSEIVNSKRYCSTQVLLGNMEKIVTKQYYIHQDVELWFKQCLDQIYGIGVLKYKNQYHFELEHFRFLKVWGDEVYMKSAIEQIKNMHLQTQYQIPWINENVYYVRSSDIMEPIEAKLLSKNINRYTISNSNEFTELWFHNKDLKVFTFEALTKTKRRVVDRLFLQIAEIYKDPILTISHTLPFHRSVVPFKPATRMLSELNGAYLKYLSVEDMLALELANRDHCRLWFDTTIHHDIQHSLKKQISPQSINSFLMTFKHPLVLSYFIFKFRNHFHSRIIIPSILLQGDIKLLSQLLGIDIGTEEILLPKKPKPNNHNRVSSELIDKYLSPVTGYSIFHNFNAVLYEDEEIRNTIVVRKLKYSTPTVLNKIFTDLAIFLNSHHHHAVDLHLIGIDINMLSENSFAHFALFRNIIFQEMAVHIKTLTTLFRLMTDKISLFNCHIESEINTIDILETPLRVSQIVFKHMNFESDTLIKLLTNCNEAAVQFNDCKIVSTIEPVEMFTKTINLSYVEFKYMRLTSELLTVIQKFGAHFVLCFNDCNVTSEDIWNIYTKTQIQLNRIKIMAEHHLHENIILGLYAAYYRKNSPFHVEESDFDVPSELIPQIESLTSKFNWLHIKLTRKRVDDHTIKVDIVKKGMVVDLFIEEIGSTEAECEIDYY